jgi:hypothetical protein
MYFSKIEPSTGCLKIREFPYNALNLEFANFETPVYLFFVTKFLMFEDIFFISYILMNFQIQFNKKCDRKKIKRVSHDYHSSVGSSSLLHCCC